MSTKTKGGPWGPGMHAAVSSLQQRILTVTHPEEGGKMRITQVRLRNQQDPKDWVGLAGFLGPMSDLAWRAFIQQRKEQLREAPRD